MNKKGLKLFAADLYFHYRHKCLPACLIAKISMHERTADGKIIFSLFLTFGLSYPSGIAKLARQYMQFAHFVSKIAAGALI